MRQIELKGCLTPTEIEEIRESRRKAVQSDNLEEDIECNVNEILYQKNTSSYNLTSIEIPSETWGEPEHVRYFDGNEYTGEELELVELLN